MYSARRGGDRERCRLSLGSRRAIASCLSIGEGILGGGEFGLIILKKSVIFEDLLVVLEVFVLPRLDLRRCSP